MANQHKVILLFNANNIYDRQILQGIGYFLQKGQINWNIYIADNLRCDSIGPLLFDCDGIIANFDEPDIVNMLLKNQTIPLVGVGASYHDENDYPSIAYVAADNQALIEGAFNHLLSKGLKTFAMYSMPDSSQNRWALEREVAFKQILAKKGYIGTLYRGFETSMAYWQDNLNDLADWLRSLPINTGIIAVNDARARHILQACRMINIKVPEELCVIGIDNEEVINSLSSVSLSSIIQGSEEMGYQAAYLLQKKLTGESKGTPRRLIAPKQIVERNSTDYRSIQDPYVLQAIHYIRNHAHLGIKVKQVLSELKISRSNLEGRFEQEMGQSIHSVIHEEKFNQAKLLLTNTNLPMREIFQRCGYPSLQYFYFLFKKTLNLTPKQYRERYGNPLQH